MPILFENCYECEACDCAWIDIWECACNDRCPGCRAEIEPYDSRPFEDPLAEKETP